MVEELAGFTFDCPRAWDSLQPSADNAERWCDACSTMVILCATPSEARAQSRKGRCVALPTMLTAPPRRRRNETPVLPPARPSPAPKTVTVGMLVDSEHQRFPIVAWVVPLDGPRAGETFRLAAVTDVGAAPPADIVFPDAELATPHARFVATALGYLVLDDADAGTYVNDRRITRCELVDSDVIRVGRVRLMFKTID